MPKKPWDTANELKSLTEYLAGDVVSHYNGKATLAEKTAYRDAVIYGRLRAIDITYFQFVTSMAKERNLQAVGTDAGVLGLTGTAALMTPASTKSILAAISGGIVGIKGSIDKNLFYDKTMPVLLTQMEALRKQRLATILQGINTSADKYSLTQAMIDLEDYFQAGTIPNALVAINAASGASSERASNEIKELKVSNFTFGAADDAAVVEKIRTWLRNGGTEWDITRRQELDTWLRKNKITDSGVTVFLNGPFKAQRSAFVSEHKLP
jgi:hypothetical protein